MSADSMGRRYERLLFFSAPLAIACILVLFISAASDEQEDRRLAKCARAVAEAVGERSDELVKAWQGGTATIKGQETDNYVLAVRYVFIFSDVSNLCDRETLLTLESRADEWKQSPETLIKTMKAQAEAFERNPLSWRGVELPDRATLNAVGTPIKIDLLVLVRMMQFALMPLLILWLGSLYNTRHREAIYNARILDVRQLYPHVINVYPVVDRRVGFPVAEFKRRNWMGHRFDSVGVPLLYMGIRIALLLVFIGPPVGAYLASLFLMGRGEFGTFFFITGLVVVVFTFANLMMEGHVSHWRKRYIVTT